jgi:hypothetical protein
MDSAKRYNKDPNIVSRMVAEECILVPIVNKADEVDSIYTLNEVGCRIWELVDGEKSIEDIRDTIIDEFDVTPDEADADVREFMVQLENIGAVRYL